MSKQDSINFVKMMAKEPANNIELNEFSDYGSGNCSDSSTMSWGGLEAWPTRTELEIRHQKQRSASIADMVMSGRTINDVMQEFQMNGYDSPYNPDENVLRPGLQEFGSSGVLMRQKSWPEPERTPIQRLPQRWSTVDLTPTPSVPAAALTPETSSAMAQYNEVITEEQRRVLASLPYVVVQALLRQLEQEADGRRRVKKQDQWCRFCRNNGEREAYYRSHALKDADGRVRCPVLRALVCVRCGAAGDRAHTIKYCPLSTAEERIKSAAMMRSVRLASGRRRLPEPEFVRFGAPPAGTPQPPLHPLWAALEQKLML